MKQRITTTILSAITFAIIIFIPVKASAANFSCSNKIASVSGSNYSEVLTVNQTGSIALSQITSIDVNPVGVTGSRIIPPSSSVPGSASTQIIFTFSNLAPSTNYQLLIAYPANGQLTSEEVLSCDFTSSNGTVAGTSSTTTTPPSTATSSTCSSTNVTDDTCYEQYCTGQASEDSQSCGSYATAYATKDDNGDTSCASINSTNDTTCCDNATDSPMCIAYNDYSAKEAQAQSGTSATTPATASTLTSTGGIVSPDGDGLIPCDGDDCTINSVVQLLDNIMSFFFKTLLLPIFVVMVMYLGYSYLTAGGKPGQHAKVISMAQHMVGGLVLMLCAWLIVHTILSVLGYTDTLGFFG